MESAYPDTLFTSVLSIGEIRKGIELLAAGKKRSELERWIDSDLNGWFGNNLLPVTKAISNRWGILAARLQQQGKTLGNIAGLLAATAFEHGLTVATAEHAAFRGHGREDLRPLERLGQYEILAPIAADASL